MKPYQTKRTRDYYRHHRNRVIIRKRDIAKQLHWHVLHQQFGRLSKGKIHCSCQKCSEKTHLLGHKHSEKVKLFGLSDQVSDYHF